MKTIWTSARKLLLTAAAGINLLFLPVSVTAGPGDLDPSFGPPRSLGGVRTFQMNDKFEPCCIAQQLDGKLLVAGMKGNSLEVGYLILRRHLVTNGALDTAFGLGGTAVAIGPDPAVPVYGKPSAIAIQPDGKILVAGTRSDGKPVLWRFTTSGQLDTAFAHEGELVLNTSSNGVASGVAVRAGKILVLVSVSSGSFILRRAMNGSADLAFGFFGLVQVPDWGDVLGIDQADGSIYVAGSDMIDGHVFRFSENGTHDSAFGTDGQVTVTNSQCGLGQTYLSDIEVQPDGKVVIAGQSYWFGNTEPELSPYLIRLTSAGDADTTFGGSSPLCLQPRTYPPVGYPWNVPTFYRQNDGRIVALAYDSESPALKRLNTDGSTDTAFDPAYSTTGFSYDVLVQSADGKVVVFATPAVMEPEAYRLIRYLP